MNHLTNTYKIRNKETIVPPIKCQGIKTKLVKNIINLINNTKYERWVEPFCGSCVVGFNVQPNKAIFSDTNVNIIRFYKDIQDDKINYHMVNLFLYEEGKKLKSKGEDYYYQVRERFNKNPNSLDFLFLNRSCFNGLMRFNSKNEFNVPFCRKRDRFDKSYVTKITNQIKTVSSIIKSSDYEFVVMDFKEAIKQSKEKDLLYCDPPYIGRHTDYYNNWSENDEKTLSDLLQKLNIHFVLSTWGGNEFRSNLLVNQYRQNPEFNLTEINHFYHIGSTESLRHEIIEILVTNIKSISVCKQETLINSLF